MSSGYARQSQSLIWALLEADPRASDGGYRSAILAGDMIEELGSGLGREGRTLKEEVITELVALVQQGRLSAKERVEAALLLGRLGDPRLPRPEQDDYWCAVAPGTFWYGDDRRNELQRKQFTYGFKIARFPVTNAEYAAFVAAGGYTHEAWWTPEGWRWRVPGGRAFSWEDNEHPISGPRLEQDSRFNAPTQPVVGVSWYEAAAYSNWLTAQGHAQGWLPIEAEIRLPTSLEWEYAARGMDSQRRYPWGDGEPTSEHANYAATGIGQPAPVGCFPLGRAACGAEDLAGNVMEWMATAGDAREETAARRDFEPFDRVLLSRSDYTDEEELLCCGSRFWYFPFDRYGYQGFRVVWSLRAH